MKSWKSKTLEIAGLPSLSKEWVTTVWCRNEISHVWCRNEISDGWCRNEISDVWCRNEKMHKRDLYASQKAIIVNFCKEYLN